MTASAATAKRIAGVEFKHLSGEAKPLGKVEALPPRFRDRVKDLRRVKAAELRRNPKNWRLHPETQRGALEGLLEQVGFVGALVAREVDGQLELIDGHLRADVAADAEVPVLVVDLTDSEAATVPATFDPLGEMALIDEAALGALLGEVKVDEHAELRRMLSDLHDKLAKEEEEQTEEPTEVPGMALTPHEHYDYLVVLATTAQEWNIRCERLGLEPEKRRGRLGTCRAIRAKRLLDALKDK
jgi:hypothetical protein